ncbi:unnamed protein product [Victoria cruziana]
MERQATAAALTSEGRKGKERARKQDVAMEEEEEEEDEEEEEKRKRATTTFVLGRKSSNSGQAPCCQAENCSADLTTAKRYHRRHKVCETHSKAAIVMVAGLRQRFCQQCSRFHEISEFDEAKRSCRRRLAGHNERRRKNSVDSQADGTSRRGIGHQLKDNHCRPSEEAGRMQITLQGNRTCKHFQIR